MAVKVKYSDPQESWESSFSTLEEFLVAKPWMRQLLSEGREKHDITITLEDSCCPFTETFIITQEGE